MCKSKMEFVYNDGGRKAAGYTGDAGDCVTRAIAIATGKSYQEVYDAMFNGIRNYRENRWDRLAKRLNLVKGTGRKASSPRSGVSRKIFGPYLESLGWRWFPTMKIGQGCKVHLRAEELPEGRLIVKVSKHICAVIDGVVHDTYQDDRDGTRCVYGYYMMQPQ